MSWLGFVKRMKMAIGSTSVVVSKGIMLVVVGEGENSRRIRIFERNEYEEITKEKRIKQFKNNILFTSNHIEAAVNPVAPERTPPFHFDERINLLLSSENQTAFEQISIGKPTLAYLLYYFENNPVRIFMGDWFFDHPSSERTTDHLALLGGFLSRATRVFRCLHGTRKRFGKTCCERTILGKIDSILLYLSMNGFALGLNGHAKVQRHSVSLETDRFIPCLTCKDEFIAKKYIQATVENSCEIKYLFWYQILERISQKVAPAIILAETKETLSAARGLSEMEKYRRVQSGFKDDSELTVLKKAFSSLVPKEAVERSIGKKLKGFYETNMPKFIAQESAKLDFSSQTSFARSASERVYRIRNAIVHSNDESIKRKGRETPFDWTKDDKTLSQELPLLKAIVDCAIQGYFSKRNKVFGEKE